MGNAYRECELHANPRFDLVGEPKLHARHQELEFMEGSLVSLVDIGLPLLGTDSVDSPNPGQVGGEAEPQGSVV